MNNTNIKVFCIFVYSKVNYVGETYSKNKE